VAFEGYTIWQPSPPGLKGNVPVSRLKMKGKIMKTHLAIIVATVFTSLVAYNAIAAAALPTVGPDPSGLQSHSVSGQLEVFSKLKAHSQGNNPPWYQHVDYYIYDLKGNELQHVDNKVGYYASAPRTITLPAGHYLIKASAKGAYMLDVPVVIESGRMTSVHLDGTWKLPANTPATKFVNSPSGYPVGWRFNGSQ
jgi:hypothetical protein